MKKILITYKFSDEAWANVRHYFSETAVRHILYSHALVDLRDMVLDRKSLDLKIRGKETKPKLKKKKSKKK